MNLVTTDLPDAPETVHARWLVSRLRDGGEPLALDELREHCAPVAREETSLDGLLEQARSAAAALSGGELWAVQRNHGGLVAGVRAGDGTEHRLALVIQQDEPHLIANLGFSPAPAGLPVDREAIEAGSDMTGAGSGLPPELAARLDESLLRVRAEGRLVGLLGALVRGGELLWFRGLGFADAGARTPMTGETVIRVGSVSKPITAVGVLQLRDAGLIDIERPANDYLRALVIEQEPGDPPVTVRHLLTHTGGIVDPKVEPGVPGGTAIPTPAQLYGGRLRARAPGTRWAYSNHGYTTLGQLVEDVTGVPFADHMRRALFHPLGMGGSDYVHSSRLGGPAACPYSVDLGRVLAVPYTEVSLTGAGSVFSTTRDMARFIGLVAGVAQDVLAETTVREMTSPQPGPEMPLGRKMGLGFVVKEGPPRLVWHNGGWYGANTAMWVSQERGLGILLYTNTWPHPFGTLDEAATGLLEAACEAL
jgi:CubicO group peptidase (beta-lactamase class C family)